MKLCTLYGNLRDIMRLTLLIQTSSAYSAPGTPPANRSSFVGVTPRDPGGLYQAQVSKLHFNSHSSRVIEEFRLNSIQFYLR